MTDERIRVEITEESAGFTTTFAAEALSPTDAVNAAVDALEAYDETLDDDDDGGITVDNPEQ